MGGMKFQGTSAWGHTIVTDSKKEVGGSEDGVKPTELLMYAIAGCTGMDVVSLLKKMKQELTALEIEVTGHQNDDYPKPFHKIEVNYVFSGKDLDISKLERAVELSQDKYCVISQTIKGMAIIKTTVSIV